MTSAKESCEVEALDDLSLPYVMCNQHHYMVFLSNWGEHGCVCSVY